MNKQKKFDVKNMNKSFSRNRRLKSFLFLSITILIGIFPAFLNIKIPIYLVNSISLTVLFYGIWVLSRNFQIPLTFKNNSKANLLSDFPSIDILVAARDEQNVIKDLVERLFNLDYPAEKLSINVIDDGSTDKTPLILETLSKKYEKLQIISRSHNAGGGKSGALNYALKYINGDWVFILDADAQLKQDTLLRLLNFALKGSWSVVQLRKSVINSSKNLLTGCQAIEMAMDTYFQCGRLFTAGVSELRGNGQLIKKDILIKCGSFNENTVTDDLDLSVRLLLSQTKIGILWDPPVMEEGVETISALFSQRQRWAEGGLQRFFDYGHNLIFGELTFIQKFDLLYFFLLQYALPIISLIDLITGFIFFKSPSYWPISLTAFMLSAIASWLGCIKRHEGPTLQGRNLLNILVFLIYLSHWFVIIPWVTLKMSILPKKILWKKTLHKGQ